MIKTDFLVLGSGIAGLTFALEAAKHGKVLVVSKKELTTTSTSWAQGGIAAVTEADDSSELHIQDTITAGANLSDKKIVEIVVNEGIDRVDELIKLGAIFDKENGKYHLHQEGGHSRRRIFHAGDATGWIILKTLLDTAKQNSNITFLENHFAVDLLTTREQIDRSAPVDTCYGAYVLDEKGTVKSIFAKKTCVATGGAGKVYLYTSNPDVATGDGIAMCFRAGVSVANLEFFQFHPTCLYHPQAKSFLITEALRGEGGILKRINGEAFMSKYHSLKELAPRDIVARAIDNEMKTHGEDYVLLDVTHKPASYLKEHFPTVYERCLSFGIDIATTPIPVVPAAHYCCGGVVTDEHGATTIEGLYVAGEAAYTGLHGANRLASNSLLEGLVFGKRAAIHAVKNCTSMVIREDIPAWNSGEATNSDEQVVISQNWDEIRRAMWNYVGIVRTTKRLERAKHRVQLMAQEIESYYWDFKITPDLLELRNLTLVAKLIIESALKRKESRGLHFTLDFPELHEQLNVPTIIESL
jgi:L-aspartate oxidase